jgi:hypothetical protein
MLVFDRFLARIVDVLGDTVVLKGGLVVEYRVERARTTKDIDVRVVGPPAALDARLERAAGLELGDFMRFVVAPDSEHPKITNEGMAYEGLRYRVTCELAGKIYGNPSGSTSRLPTPSSASLTSWLPKTYSASLGSGHLSYGSARSKLT